LSSRREGASRSRTLLAHRLAGWLQHHRLSAADSLLKVLDNPFASVLTWLVIGIALALPVGLDQVMDNAGRLGASWDHPAQLSLFLREDIDGAQAQALAARVAGRADVEAASFLARDAALEEFSTLSGFADVLASMPQNPLPNLLLVTPAPGLEDAALLQALHADLAALDEVDEAVLDMAWLQRLRGLIDLGRRAALVLGAMLVLGVVLILGNTIRLSIESRREEIVVVKLVGGSNAFVRRPFLYTGLWYGSGGGLVAGLLVWGALWYLGEPVARLAALYGSSFELAGPGVMGVLNLVILGGLLGLAGAWLAVARHLSAIEPGAGRA
tara:strand:+ start:954 stop:1934 length:981 start_codon:yes stop_codon:yes gene_type:complete